jgi:hypothetical protein
MITKHFIKILVIFTGMIVFGLLGISIINHFGFEKNFDILDNTQVAK